MKRSRDKFLYLAGAALAVVAIPAASQQAPESILPPGFGTNDNLPPAQQQQPRQQPRGPQPQPDTGAAPAPPSASPDQTGATPFTPTVGAVPGDETGTVIE